VKLVGVAFEVRGGPVARGYVGLDELTVLLGPNDSGKTRALRAVEATLAALWGDGKGRMLPATDLDSSLLSGTAFFACSWDEAHGLARWRLDLEEVTLSGVAGCLDRASLGEAFGLAKRIGRLVEIPDPSDLVGAVENEHREAFGETPIVAVNASAAPAPGCHACAALCALPRGRASRRFLTTLEEAGVDIGAFSSQTVERSGASTAAPIPVVNLGEVDLRGFRRRVVVAPLASERTDDLVGDAVQALAYELRWGALRWLREVLTWDVTDADVGDALEGLDDPDVDVPPRGGRALVIDSDDVVRTHPDVRVAAAYVETQANLLVPTFVGDRYRLEVCPNDPVQIGAGQLVSVLLRDRQTGTMFPPAAGPGGYRLWAELAAAEAARRGHEQANSLAQVLDLALDAAEREEAGVVDDDTEPPITDRLARNLDWLSATYGSLQATTRGQTPRSLAPAITESIGLRPTAQAVYLIDEPEQHMHPRLQRRASRWLLDFLRERGAQAIVATHSPAFSELRDGVVLQEVARGGAKAIIQRPRAKALGALDLLTAEMGFDRGELLAAVNAFLFVEGLADRAVLEALYGERLAAAGVSVLAVHGQRKQAGVLDMELLLRYMGTPVSVLLDSVTDDDVRRLRRSRSARLVALADGRRDERHTIATILEAEARSERRVEVFALGLPDIFDALDARAITELHPQYPGHAQAASDLPQGGSRPNAATRKQLYKERYDVRWSAGDLGRYAKKMRQLGLRSPALDHVIDAVERIAIEPKTD
jgi:AAA domain, putative AbiEii toxin, Type IV TA system